MEYDHVCKIDEQSTERERNFLSDEATVCGIADSFKVLGDRTRMKIVFALLYGEKNVCTIAALIGSTHSNTSHQLKVLKDNRVVDYKKNGKEVCYFLADHHIKELIQISLVHFNHDHCED